MAVKGSTLETHTIIVVNPLPKLYILDLVDHLMARSSTEVKLQVLVFYRSKLLPTEVVTRLRLHGAECEQVVFSGPWDYAYRLRQAGRTLKSWIADSSRNHFVYHCQPNHVLTNYVTFAASTPERRVRCTLIPDGLANFYNTDVRPYRRRMMLKRLVGWLVGLRYTNYTGGYLALESADYDSYLYFGNPGVMPDYLSCDEFLVTRPTGSATQDVGHLWLFLGQPIAGDAQRQYYYRLILNVYHLANQNLAYKPHPAERLDKSLMNELKSAGITVLETDETAEELASSYLVLAGVASSALLNVRLLGWSSEVYSLMNPAHIAWLFGRSLSEAEDVAMAMRNAGVIALSTDV